MADASGVDVGGGVSSGVGLTLKADYFLRESNSRNFDLDSLTLTAGVSYFF